MDFICNNIIKSDIDSILSNLLIPSSLIPSSLIPPPITIPTVDITEHVINEFIKMTSNNYVFNMKNNETIKPEDVINTFIKMTYAKYAFNTKNAELIKTKQRLFGIYVNYRNMPTKNICEELSRIRVYQDYYSAALGTWREGNNYILHRGIYIGMLFNTARKAAAALAAALNREYWLESLIKNDIDIRTSLRTVVEEASNIEIEARHRLCIAIDEPNTNKSLIEIYNNIVSSHLSLAKVVAELSISPLCIEMLDNNSDLNVITTNINNIFTSITPNIEYINILYNTIKVANKLQDKEAPDSKAPDSEAPDSEAPDSEAPDSEAPDSEAPDSEAPDSEAPDSEAQDINVLKAFENAKNNVILELTNIYMYELNEGIRVNM